ncbi:hypothetical protein [Lysobacter gummosus]|uniref:hypothetical protein n=1 Tax=Lysobacter gummosus TaxID=262324 RepID=UPI00362849A9
MARLHAPPDQHDQLLRCAAAGAGNQVRSVTRGGGRCAASLRRQRRCRQGSPWRQRTHAAGPSSASGERYDRR